MTSPFAYLGLIDRGKSCIMARLKPYLIQSYWVPMVGHPLKGNFAFRFTYIAPGFVIVMCANLREARKKLAKVADGNISALISPLADTLDLWNFEEKDSESDVFKSEVGKSHRPKRVPRIFWQTSENNQTNHNLAMRQHSLIDTH